MRCLFFLENMVKVRTPENAGSDTDWNNKRRRPMMAHSRDSQVGQQKKNAREWWCWKCGGSTLQIPDSLCDSLNYHGIRKVSSGEYLLLICLQEDTHVTVVFARGRAHDNIQKVIRRMYARHAAKIDSSCADADARFPPACCAQRKHLWNRVHREYGNDSVFFREHPHWDVSLHCACRVL